MQGQRVGLLIFEVLAELQLVLAVVAVVGPDADGAINGASGDELLLDADVEPLDRLPVERGHQVVVRPQLIRRLVQINLYADNLVALCAEEQLVFLGAQGHVGHFLVHHIVVDAEFCGLTRTLILIRHHKVVLFWLNTLVRLAGAVTLDENANHTAVTSDNESRTQAAFTARGLLPVVVADTVREH